MPDQPRLLWHSNAPWSPTGYGSQTALFAPHLAEHHRFGISAFYGLEGNVQMWHGDIPVYPGIGSTYGNETINHHAQVHFGNPRDGLIVTLMDVWPLDPKVWGRHNVASWCPIDHEPAPRPVTDFFFDTGAVPIAMSKFGPRMFKDMGLDALYVPHAIDTSVYKPIEKVKARNDTKLPEDAFIVGMVAANKGNPSRKCFSEAIQGFKVLYEQHPEARLYLHTEFTGMFDGVNLPELVRDCGLTLDAVIFPDQYRVVHYPFKPTTMAAIYSSFDVLLAPSAGEGFGIPVIEAQACGVPVIVSDFSAQTELCGSGWLVEGIKHYTPLKAWQFTPSVDDIVDALRQAYSQSEPARAAAAEKARSHAEEYDIKRVLAHHMLPALEECYERFDARKPVELKAAA